MPYDSVISRTDAAALIPEDVASSVLTKVTEESAALTLFRSVPMSRKQQRLPIVSALPTAYFVNGDTGLKQTTEAAWTNKYLDAEEIACIVPIPESVIDDSEFDAWASVQPLLVEAIGRTLDAAVFFGTNKPAVWPSAIVTAAAAAGNTRTRGTATAAQGGIAGDISETFGKVEDDGYDVNGAIATRKYRGLVRQTRSTAGEKLGEVTQDSWYGTPVQYPMRGIWPTATGGVEAIVGDFNEGILGVRQDITYKVLDQAVIQDGTGAIVYNLAQQDMVALRVVARFGFQVANIINNDQPTEANRYPFATLLVP